MAIWPIRFTDEFLSRMRAELNGESVYVEVPRIPFKDMFWLAEQHMDRVKEAEHQRETRDPTTPVPDHFDTDEYIIQRGKLRVLLGRVAAGEDPNVVIEEMNIGWDFRIPWEPPQDSRNSSINWPHISKNIPVDSQLRRRHVEEARRAATFLTAFAGYLENEEQRLLETEKLSEGM